MATIQIITFQRDMKITQNLYSVPSPLAHWGIIVEYKNGNNDQFLYHADKESFFNTNTNYKTKNIDFSTNISRKIDKIVLVGYSSLQLTHENMEDICINITKDRIFNTIGNNCQEWVKSVLSELVKTGNLSHLCLEELKKDNEITPLLGW